MTEATRSAVFSELLGEIASQAASKTLFTKVGDRGQPRVLVKVGTTVITDQHGQIALGRVGNVVDQICQLKRSGIQVRALQFLFCRLSF
jgi:hypothetical protein